MHAELILAVTNNGHGKWWYGIPVTAVVLIVRVGFWSRHGRRRRGGGSRWNSRNDGQR
jgi:hypothetical protein